MWPGGHTRRERLTGGVGIVRGQPLRISVRFVLRPPVVIGGGDELGSFIRQRLGGREQQHGDRLTGRISRRIVRRERDTGRDIKWHDEHDRGYLHVDRIVLVAGVGLVDVARDRGSRELV